jgi:hypothetical protein
MGIWLLVGATLIAAIAYAAWEFRWYWSTLVKTWRNDDTSTDRELDHELAGHKEH